MTRRKATPAVEAPHPYTDASRGGRLQKVLAAAGVASRRACEELITSGAVTVNGQVVMSLPAWVDPAQDRIEVDGRPLPRKSKAKATGWSAGASASQPSAAPLVYVALNKPRGVIATTSDELGRRSVLDLIELPRIDDVAPPRLYPVGRLDAESGGLILLTNDGELANRLTHPRYGVSKEYEVSVRGRVGEDDLARMRSGMYLSHRSKQGRKPGAKFAKVAEVSLLGQKRDDTHGDRSVLHITMREGQIREIDRILLSLGFDIRKTKRVAVGPVRLKGLGPGKWRFLTPQEIAQLKKAGSEGKRREPGRIRPEKRP